LAAIGTHVLPGIFSDMSRAIGNHLAGLNYSRPKSQVIRVGSRHAKDGVAVTAVNGILNSLEDSLNFGKNISRSHGNVYVDMIYNSSHGFFSDILEVVMDAVGIPSRPARLLASQWRSLLQAKTGSIHHYAHSQGGTITKNALSLLTSEERSHIHVMTFGSSSLIGEKEAGSVANYAHNRDIVPMFGMINYLKARVFGSSHVHFMGRPFGRPRHSWEEDCYSNLIHERGIDFIDKYFK
jgi:hypothetical protein